MNFSKFKKFLSVYLLLGVFAYATSVRELHHTFSVRYHSTLHADHCDHHIHNTAKDSECYICSVDVHHLYDSPFYFYVTRVAFRLAAIDSKAVSKPYCCERTTYYLRGPPRV